MQDAVHSILMPKARNHYKEDWFPLSIDPRCATKLQQALLKLYAIRQRGGVFSDTPPSAYRKRTREACCQVKTGLRLGIPLGPNELRLWSAGVSLDNLQRDDRSTDSRRPSLTANNQRPISSLAIRPNEKGNLGKTENPPAVEPHRCSW